MPSILLAETANKVSSLTPGKKAAIDSMRYCDFPVFGKDNDWVKEYRKMNDAELFLKVRNLFYDLTLNDDLRQVAIKMLSRLESKQGGTFTDSKLNDIVSTNVYFSRWINDSSNRIAGEVKKVKGNMSKYKKITDLKRFAFTHSTGDIFNKGDDLVARKGGLGILINQVWAATIEMESHEYNIHSKTFYANLKYTLYDDFGLDVPDIMGWVGSTTPSSIFPPRLATTGFKAWFVLQRYKCYTPFITKIEIRKRISFRLEKL